MSTQLGHAPSQPRRCFRHIYHLPPQLTLIPHGALICIRTASPFTGCRVRGVSHAMACHGPHAVCRMPHATSRVLCVQLLSRRLSTQIVPISVNKMLTFSLKLRSTQLDMPPTQAHTHRHTHSLAHTQILARRRVCFACLSWFYTLLRRLIVLLLFNAILLVLANFELSSRFGLNLKAAGRRNF